MTVAQRRRGGDDAHSVTGSAPDLAAVPRTPRAYVPRRRLWGQLDLLTRSAVTVLVAPAGAGKTLGVAGWIRDRAASDDRTVGATVSPAGWVTADATWTGERLARLLAAPAADDGDAAAEVADRPRRLLVIDDAHLLPTSALRYLDRRLNTDPQSLSLLMLSRWDLLMGNLPAELLGNLTTLRGDLLRLDDDESEALIREHAQTDDPVVLQEIRQQANGWPAIVVLAARSAGRAADHRPSWLNNKPSPMQVADRVVSEVFSTLSNPERHLLLCVASEETITVQMAVLLSRDDRAGEILERLESTGLLVTQIPQLGDEPLGGAQYRIHPLLAEVVRRRLAAGGVDVDQAQATVVRAVRLDLNRGDVVAAFSRLVAIKELELAADLLATDGFTVWCRGHGDEIRRFAQRYPNVIADDPRTWFIVALERWFAGDVTSAQSWMNRLVREYGGDPSFAVRIACLRLMLAPIGFETIEAAAANARRLLTRLQGSFDLIADRETAELALLCTELGIAENWLGDLVHAEIDLRAGVGLCRSLGLPLHASYGLSHLAFTEYMAGREHTARQVAAEALALSAEHGGAKQRCVESRASLVLALCRSLDLPRPTARQIDRHSGTHPADLCSEFWNEVIVARVRMLDGDLDGAAGALDAPLNLPVLAQLPDHLGVALAIERALVAAVADDRELIKEIRDRLASSDFIGESALLGGLLADMRGDRREAVELFDTAADDVTFIQLGCRAIALTCAAQLLDALGDHEQALDKLQAATVLTAVRRNAGPFFGWSRQGTPIKTMIDNLQDRSPTPWGAEIAAAAGSMPDAATRFASRTPTPTERSRTPDGLIIPMLSAREREVLRELARGSTYADIGATLFVSENTVKTHVSSLYSKLSANRRSEALAIARSMHLL